MPLELHIEPSLERINRKLAAAGRRLDDISPIMKSIAVILDQWAQRNFQQDGRLAMDGKPWTPLKPITRKGERGVSNRIYFNARQKRSGGLHLNAKILRDTGKGRASIKTGYARSYAEISTTDRRYMAYHHQGAGALPERRVIPLYRQVKDKVNDTIDHFLVRVWPKR